MYFTSTISAFAVILCVVAVPIKNDTAASTTTLTHGNLIARAVSNLPTADVTCAGGVENGQNYGQQQFNDFQVDDAAQQGLNDLANGNMHGKNHSLPLIPVPHSFQNPQTICIPARRRLNYSLGKYPEGFDNREAFTFANCPAGSTFYEYPILRDGTVYRAGSPGPYRVIFVNNGGGNGVYCGIVYHPVSAF